jgi:hypothetical protein
MIELLFAYGRFSKYNMLQDPFPNGAHNQIHPSKPCQNHEGYFAPIHGRSVVEVFAPKAPSCQKSFIKRASAVHRGRRNQYTRSKIHLIASFI